ALLVKVTARIWLGQARPGDIDRRDPYLAGESETIAAANMQRRIRGPGGHLSNQEAGELTRACRSRRLKWVLLSHLSEHNNHPDLALETYQDLVGRHFPVGVASRYDVSEPHVV
ncbi:MAG TPA: hypothetical protein PLC79_06260, partial [Phycisphaerae bacterium]|nr:hypothetical protein [Phycisphaerae bacterium]